MALKPGALAGAVDPRAATPITLLLAALLAAPAQAASPATEASLAWLAGNAEMDEDEGPLLAPLLLEAAHAAGHDARTWPDPANPAIAFVRLPGDNGTRLLRPSYILALAHGPDPESEAVRRLRGTFDGRQFMDAGMVNDDIWAVRALRAWGVPAADPAIRAAAAAIAQAQQPDGGWGWRTTGPSSVDMSGMALVALREADALEPAVAARGADYIEAAQRDGSGYGEHVGDRPNCNSTVWAVRGLAAAGREAPQGWAFLGRLRAPDGGYAPEPGWHTNLLCTAEAAALLGDADSGRVPRPTASSRGAPSGLLAPAAGLAVAVAAWRRRPGLPIRHSAHNG